MKSSTHSFTWCMRLLCIAVVLLVGTSAQAVLIGHWTFDETDGIVAGDSVGAFDATWQEAGTNGLDWAATGQIGTAADLGGGGNQWFTIPNTANFMGGASVGTISCWVNADSDGEWRGIFKTRANGNGAPGEGGADWGLGPTSGKQLDTRYNGNPVDARLDGLEASAGWQHVVWTFTDGGDAVQYLNGVQSIDLSPGSGTLPLNNYWYFGEDTCCNGREWDGQFDDFSAWDTALTHTEVMALYQAGLAGVDAAAANLSDLAPVITAQPEDVELLLGSTDAIEFEVEAIGSPSPTYQWRKNGSNIGGATLYYLFIADPTSPADQGDYDCVVSNTHGTEISDLVNLVYTVNDITPPAISVDSGDPAEFSISMPTDKAYTYQWQLDGVDITGETSSNITIAAATPANAGNYTVVVTLDGVDVTSAPALLSIALTGLQQGMIGYWPLDETSGTTAADVVGLNDAEWQADAEDLTWVEGAIGGAADLPASVPTDYFSVDSIPQMVGATQLTLSAWVNIDAYRDWAGFLGTRELDNTSANRYFMLAHNSNDNGHFRADGGGIDATNTVVTTGGGWFHLVGVCEASGLQQIYVNGVLENSASRVWTAVTDSGRWAFGHDQHGTTSRMLNGQIDDYAIWTRSLSSSEIATIYQAAIEGGLGAIDVPDPDGPAAFIVQPQDAEQIFGDPAATNTFEVSAVGAAPISYQWRLNGVDLAGETGTTLELGPTLPSVDIDCVVSNGQGSDTSDVAKVVSVLPPVEPASMGLTVGDNGQFSITMPAGPAYAYQWNQGGAPVAGETSDTITFSPAALADDGDYTVDVTLSGETLTSSTGTLAVSEQRVVSVGNAEDTTLLQNYDTGSGQNVQADNNYGGRGDVLVGDTDSPNSQRTGLFRFDVSGFDGAVTSVEGAKLQLTLLNGGAFNYTHTIEVFRVSDANAGWVEGTANGQTQEGSACLEQAQLGDPGVDWAGGFGMDNPGVDYFTDVLGQLVLVSNSPNAVYEIELSPSSFTLDDMILNQWVAGNNAGLRVRDLVDMAGDGQAEQVSFGSSESDNPPALILSYDEMTTAPFVVLHPEDYEMVLSAGDTVTFEVAAVGGLPMSYQWRKDGFDLVGETGTTLVLDPAANTDAGDYDCVIVNASGSATSDAATLSVVLPPVTPAARTSVAGGTALFSIDVAETGNTFDWKLEGVSIGAPSANTLVITGVDSGDAGSYTVSVTTPDPITLDSSAGVLSVVQGAGGDIQAGMVGHWPMDDGSGLLASDQVGGQDGVWANATEQGLNWVTGVIGGAADMTRAGSAWFDLPDLTDLASADALTISLWMQPDGNTGYQGVFTTRGPGQTANWGINYEGGDINAMRTDNRVPSNATGGSQGFDSSNIIVGNTENWYHCVMTYDLVSGTCQVYINGANEGGGTLAFPTSIEATLWKIGLDANNTGRDFDGILDDIALWTRVLDAQEVADIYGAGMRGISVVDVVPGQPTIIEVAGLAGGQPLALTWESIAGKVYDVQAGIDLEGDDWTDIATDIAATPPSNVFSGVYTPAAGAENYRVVAREAPAIFFDDFEGANQWTLSPDTDTGNTEFELGTPNVPGVVTEAASGDNCWGTGLSSDNYDDNTLTSIRSPTINLGGAVAATLEFKHLRQLEDLYDWGSGPVATDAAMVNILDPADVNGTPLASRIIGNHETIPAEQEAHLYPGKVFVGENTAWNVGSVDLPAAAIANGSIVIEFMFDSDGLNVVNRAGWFIDDVEVK